MVKDQGFRFHFHLLVNENNSFETVFEKKKNTLIDVF